MYTCGLTVVIKRICYVVGSAASAASTSHATPTATHPPTQQPRFPEPTIQRLMSVGFSRAQVIEELTRSSGDADQALASLFAKSFQLP